MRKDANPAPIMFDVQTSTQVGYPLSWCRGTASHC